MTDMVDIIVVHDALKSSRAPDVRADDQDSLISLLIHDIFGGEILKTRKSRGWHFYNRIDGLRLDFARSEMEKSADENIFEDIPATPDETSAYFEPEEYSTFLTKFIRAFEEAIGLDKHTPDYAV